MEKEKGEEGKENAKYIKNKCVKYKWRKTRRGGGGGEKYEGRMEERKSVTSGGNSMDKG